MVDWYFLGDINEQMSNAVKSINCDFLKGALFLL